MEERKRRNEEENRDMRVGKTSMHDNEAWTQPTKNPGSERDGKGNRRTDPNEWDESGGNAVCRLVERNPAHHTAEMARADLGGGLGGGRPLADLLGA
jgi:hypothetical protein